VTEAKWLEGAELTSLLHFARDIVSDRQVRLFVCACCRRVWDDLDGKCRTAVDAAERFADGTAQPHELRFCREAAEQTYDQQRQRAFSALIRANGKRRDYVTAAYRVAGAAEAACRAAEDVLVPSGEQAFYPYPFMMDCGGGPHDAMHISYSLSACQAVFRDCCDLWREIVGNPFRDAECADEWRTDTVLAVARRAYDAREFGALPVLADALQDAGCDSTDLLNHLRDPHAEHVRGCWALDLVLGKE